MTGRGVEDAVGSNPRPSGVAALRSRTPDGVLRTLAGVLAVVPLAAVTAYRVGHNVPGGLPAGVTTLAADWSALAVVGPAFAGLLLAATADSGVERVGLAFAGGFGVLALGTATAAWQPAAIGVSVGVAVVAADRFVAPGRKREWNGVRRAAPVGFAAVGVATSLAAAAGVWPATLRPLGSGVALAAVGVVPLAVGWDRISALAGITAGLATFGIVASAPYVAGAVLLVGGGVVGVPTSLVAFAAAGGTAGAVSALRDGRPAVALGAALFCVAGVPATVLRATGVVVAAALVAYDGGERA
ncbi:hypothetical protein G3A49_07900 [Haloferax volcanii]|uniref:DUF8068 domain-containing protein n=1 Tax=Haloferax volcanii TaxID=2246 RepID=A0A6C0URD5_HALVO|nr:hypothetical protein [Haloferax alexandrinus]NLV03018.1 hypothetical protein [Haloferax alexandrinus]QIB78062.1 hypothetical protein G3A49_07900 [Haloferax alexandrinus]